MCMNSRDFQKPLCEVSQGVPNSKEHTECPGTLGSSVDFDAKGLGWGLRFCFCTMLLGDADRAGPQTSF